MCLHYWYYLDFILKSINYKNKCWVFFSCVKFNMRRKQQYACVVICTHYRPVWYNFKSYTLLCQAMYCIFQRTDSRISARCATDCSCLFSFCSFIRSLLLVFYLYHIHFVYIYTLSVDLILQHVIIEVEMGTEILFFYWIISLNL
jgi:hypothetical protein